jgi:hypothetical protein
LTGASFPALELSRSPSPSTTRFHAPDRLRQETLLEAWSHVLNLEKPLPTLPLWLSKDLVVPRDLGQSYEQACNDLWIA